MPVPSAGTPRLVRIRGALSPIVASPCPALGPRPHVRAEAAESVDGNAHDQAFLTGLPVRVLVDPEESLREFVGVGVGSFLRHRRRAVDDQIGLRLATI